MHICTFYMSLAKYCPGLQLEEYRFHTIPFLVNLNVNFALYTATE